MFRRKGTAQPVGVRIIRTYVVFHGKRWCAVCVPSRTEYTPVRVDSTVVWSRFDRYGKAVTLLYFYGVVLLLLYRVVRDERKNNRSGGEDADTFEVLLYDACGRLQAGMESYSTCRKRSQQVSHTKMLWKYIISKEPRSLCRPLSCPMH